MTAHHQYFLPKRKVSELTRSLTSSEGGIVLRGREVEVACPDVGETADGIHHRHTRRSFGIGASHVNVESLVQHDLGPGCDVGQLGILLAHVRYDGREEVEVGLTADGWDKHHGKITCSGVDSRHGDNVDYNPNAKMRCDDRVDGVLSLRGEEKGVSMMFHSIRS